MKNAKKSMFITTILMVAVLIVAVSTATFAWYTASGTGSAGSASLVAAESSDANIAVGWTKASKTTDITFNTIDAKFAPMAPKAALVADEAYAASTFYTQTLAQSNTFNGDGTPATPWNVVNSDADAGVTDGFYVINHNQNAGATVKMSLTFTADDNSDLLLVAVYVNGSLKGIYSQLASYAAGEIKNGAAPSTLTGDTKGTNVIAAGTELSFDLAAANADDDTDVALIQVKAWFDGSALDQTGAGDTAGFSFSFAGTTKNA